MTNEAEKSSSCRGLPGLDAEPHPSMDNDKTPKLKKFERAHKEG